MRYFLLFLSLLISSQVFAEHELNICPLAKIMPITPPHISLIMENEDGLYSRSLGASLSLDGVSAHFVFPAWSYKDSINNLSRTGHKGVWTIPDPRFCFF